MKYLKFLPISLAIIGASLSLAGCDSIGNAPAGPSPEEAKADFKKQSLDVKIKMIEGSPMSRAQKDKMIADAKAEAASAPKN